MYGHIWEEGVGTSWLYKYPDCVRSVLLSQLRLLCFLCIQMYLLTAVTLAIMCVSADHVKNSCGCRSRTLEQVYHWSVLEYDTPSNYIPPKGYIPTYSYITTMEVIPSGLLVATPRQGTISPATLSLIPLPGTDKETDSPIFRPYPNITFNTIKGDKPNCNATLVSVANMVRDKCNRLWVADFGVVNLLFNPQQICPPKIVIIDLSTDSVVRIVPIPESVAGPKSAAKAFSNIVLDDVVASDGSTASCDNLYAYISDTIYSAIIVYRGSGRDSPGSFHKVSHPYMFPDPSNFPLKVLDEVTPAFYGLYGLAIGVLGGKRILYFQAVNSDNVYTIPTSILQQPPAGNNPLQLGVKKAFTKQSSSLGLHVDSTDGCVIFNPVSQGSVDGWNPFTYNQRRLVDNPSLITWIFGFKQINSTTTYAVSSAVQRIINQNVDPNDINIRILSLNLKR